jgi:L,D-transpeptidase catalytic domain
MRAVTRRICLVSAGFAAAALGVTPAIATAQAEIRVSTIPAATTAGTAAAKPKRHTPSPSRAHLSVRALGPHNGKLRVGQRSRAVGYLRPFVAGQRVKVKLMRRGHVVMKRNPLVKRVHNKDKGRFQLPRSQALIEPGTYRVVAQHRGNAAQRKGVGRSSRFHIQYPNLSPGDHNSRVKLFNHLLVRQGYFSTHGKRYSSKTGFAVMAFRKVNGMKRTFNASPGIFKKLAGGHGSFHLKYPGAGKHVEVDISKQVMVLANHGKPQYTYHVSTGAPATPTIRGHYHFYMRQPGFNAEGMYYSVYWHGGYAIHGYHSVPPYPASHGCVRNPIPESKFIYNWVRLGMSIYTYN